MLTWVFFKRFNRQLIELEKCDVTCNVCDGMGDLYYEHYRKSLKVCSIQEGICKMWIWL